MVTDKSYINRMTDEYLELDEMIKKLLAFKETEKFCELKPRQRIMLTEQMAHMGAYRAILAQRICYEKGEQNANL